MHESHNCISVEHEQPLGSSQRIALLDTRLKERLASSKATLTANRLSSAHDVCGEKSRDVAASAALSLKFHLFAEKEKNIDINTLNAPPRGSQATGNEIHQEKTLYKTGNAYANLTTGGNFRLVRRQASKAGSQTF